MSDLYEFHLHTADPDTAEAIVRELKEIDGWDASATENVVTWQGHLGTDRHVKALAAAFASRSDPDRAALTRAHEQLLTAAGAS